MKDLQLLVNSFQSYPSLTNLVTSAVESNPSRSTTGVVGAVDIASGLVTATLSIKPALNTKAFEEPQELDTAPPGDIDHHKLPILADSNLQRKLFLMKDYTWDGQTYISLYTVP